MNNVFTPEQRQRMGISDEPLGEVIKRGWTREQFKEAFSEQGFTFSGFEKALGMAASSVSQALTRRYPKVDEKIAAFLDVPLHVLWPNQYLRNGKPIDFRFRAETLTDEELERLNETTSVQRERIVVSLPVGVKLNDEGSPST